jgi:hypothetical protein
MTAPQHLYTDQGIDEVTDNTLRRIHDARIKDLHTAPTSAIHTLAGILDNGTSSLWKKRIFRWIIRSFQTRKSFGIIIYILFLSLAYRFAKSSVGSLGHIERKKKGVVQRSFWPVLTCQSVSVVFLCLMIPNICLTQQISALSFTNTTYPVLESSSNVATRRISSEA